jgi:fucose permease
MTALLHRGLPWQSGYWIAALAFAVVSVGFWASTRRWQLPRDPASVGDRPPSSRSGITRRALALPAVWLLIAVFFVGTGLEVAGGQWPFTLFTEGRGVPSITAGALSSVYFGSVVAGRLLAGAVAGKLGAAKTLRAAACGALAGACLLSVESPRVVGFIGLPLLGLSAGPVFSLLVAQTRNAVGLDLTPQTIGLGMTTSMAGVAGLQALTGVLASACGLQVVGPLFVVTAAAVLVLQELLARTPRAEPIPAPAGSRESAS